jgi:hypothetical protein
MPLIPEMVKQNGLQGIIVNGKFSLYVHCFKTKKDCQQDSLLFFNGIFLL